MISYVYIYICIHIITKLPYICIHTQHVAKKTWFVCFSRLEPQGPSFVNPGQPIQARLTAVNSPLIPWPFLSLGRRPLSIQVKDSRLPAGFVWTGTPWYPWNPMVDPYHFAPSNGLFGGIPGIPHFWTKPCVENVAMSWGNSATWRCDDSSRCTRNC